MSASAAARGIVDVRARTRRRVDPRLHAALDRALARDLSRPLRAQGLASDDGRGHRRDRRAHDPHRRPLAGGLRLLQLPRLRPRPRDHRRGPGLSRRVGHASQLVAPAGQPRPLRGDRGSPDLAARRRGHARAADHHPHPHVGDPAARRLRHDLPRRAGPQDDLRRLPGGAGARGGGQALPLRGPRPPRRAAARRARSHAPGLHGRRQQHDRQRARHPRVRRRRARARRAALRRRRPRLRGHRRARARRVVHLRQPRQQRRAPLRRELRPHRARRRLLEGLLLAAGLHRLPHRRQGPAQGRGTAVPVLGPVAGRLAGHRARRLRRQRDPRRRAAARPVRAHRSRAGLPGAPARPHPQPLGLPDRRDPAARLPAHRRRGGDALRARRLRDAGRLSARAQGRGRLPRPAHARPTPTPRSTCSSRRWRSWPTAASSSRPAATAHRGWRRRRSHARRTRTPAPGALAALPGRRRAAVRALRLGAAVRGERARLQPPRPLARHRDHRRHPPPSARVARTVDLVRRRHDALLARRPLHLQLPAPLRRRRPLPVARRRRLRRRLPGADGRPVDAHPPAQPGERPRGRHRLADHDARPGAALLGRPDRAVPARRDDDG